MVLSSPQTMYVTVLTGCNLVSIDTEQNFRRIARLQKLTIGLAFGNHLYPFNEVLLFHRMRDTTDLHLQPVFGLLNYRDMLLLGSIGRVLFEKLHRLVAAHKLANTFMENLDYVPADFALVNLQSLGHPLDLLLFEVTDIN
jgi:hypothetical protein